MTPLSTIRLDNATLQDRSEPSFFQTIVPFQRGAVQPDTALRLDDGSPCDIVPFGAPWEDGSVRTARVRGWTTMLAHSRKEIGVELDTGAVARASIVTPSEPPALISAMKFAPWATTSAPTGTRFKVHGRSPDGELVLTLEAEVAPSGAHLYWWFTACWSNPLNPNVNWTMPYTLSLPAIPGTIASCYWQSQKQVSAVYEPGGGTRIDFLPAGTVWGDGQMHCWRGAMVIGPPTETGIAALQQPLWAIATAESWRDSGAWGAFGDVPYRPFWWSSDQVGLDWVLRSIKGRDLMPRDPWHEGRLGMVKVPGATGDQADFGVMNCVGAICIGEPLALDLYLEDSLQDSCRPTHFCEADGSVVRAANHPHLVLWDQRPHFNIPVSPDRLGKGPSGSPFAFSGAADRPRWDRDLADDEAAWLFGFGPATTTDFHGWWGRDNQHYSLNLQACTYYLTGDPQLEILIEHECETWLSQQRIPVPPLRPGWPGTGPDAARAVGRTLLTGAWLYLSTGRADIRARIIDRVELSIVPAWFGASVQPPGARPFMIMPTDSRQLPIVIGSPGVFWWQEGLAVYGLEAAFRVTGYQPARDLAVELARSCCDYGWQWRNNNLDAQVANVSVWVGGGDVDRYDPLMFQPADGTDFALWVQAANILAQAVYHCSMNAATLVSIVSRRYRTIPNDGGPGRYAQHSAVLGDPAPAPAF